MRFVGIGILIALGFVAALLFLPSFAVLVSVFAVYTLQHWFAVLFGLAAAIVMAYFKIKNDNKPPAPVGANEIWQKTHKNYHLAGARDDRCPYC